MSKQNNNLQLRRPTGVTIVAISYIICGIVGIGWGLQYFTLREILARGVFDYGEFSVPVWEELGVLFIGLGLALFIAVYGLLKGKGWADDLAMAISLLGMISPICYIIALGAYSVYMITVALAFSVPNGIVFFYFFYGQNVTEFFEQVPPKKKLVPKEGRRPLGVTIVAILAIPAGVGGVVEGLLYLTWGTLAQVLGPQDQGWSLIFVLLGAVLILAGLASFIMAYGLLKRKRWGYWLAVIVSIVGFSVGIFFSMYTIDLLPAPGGVGDPIFFLIEFLIFFYLTGLGVKKFFGVGRKSLAKMSKGERKGVLSEIEDMLRVDMTNDEIKDQFRHLLTDAEIEELIESLRVTKPKPEEKQTPPQREFIKRQDVIDKEIFDVNGKRVGTVKDVAFTPSGTMGLVVSKPDKSEEVIPIDNISVTGDIILLRQPSTEEKPQEGNPSSSPPVRKTCPNC